MATARTEAENQAFPLFEDMGEDRVRAELVPGGLIARDLEQAHLAEVWLVLKDHEHSTDRDLRALQALVAAEEAAKAAKDTATVAKRAAFWTAFAALATLASVVISLLKDWFTSH
jgi:hypothetical protein